jgi:hypothetical protein
MTLALTESMRPRRRIDWDRDYGTVYGGAATVLEQDGRTYNMAGDEISPPMADPEPEQEGAMSDDVLKDMDGNQLRELVEGYGGTWKGVSEGMKFLRGQR